MLGQDPRESRGPGGEPGIWNSSPCGGHLPNLEAVAENRSGTRKPRVGVKGLLGLVNAPHFELRP